MTHRRGRLARQVAALSGAVIGSLLATAPSVAGAAPPGAAASSPVVIQLAAGHANECAVLSTHRVECWGWNKYGELGDGTYVSSNVPRLVRGLGSVRDVAVGFGHACALLESGQVKCWGWNNDGQLGDESLVNTTVPVLVRHLSDVRQLSLGFANTCAVLTSGRVKCWGWNYYGQLGDGTHIDRWLPRTVSGITDALSVAAGYGHTCAVLATHRLRCWGWNLNGELGDGGTSSTTHPVLVRGLVGVRGAAAGFVHTCATLANGTVWCWGRNNDGQLGDGGTAQRVLPTRAKPLVGALDVAVGYGHSCARLRDGRVECWGLNEFGELGIGRPRERGLAPTPTTMLRSVIEITVGDDSTCALLHGHAYSCWGSDKYGQLGDGARHNVFRPPFRPGPPIDVRVTAHGNEALVSWHAPELRGAGAVERYTVTARDLTSPVHGGEACTWRAGPLRCTVRGLTEGDRYRFKVVAAGAGGRGRSSSASGIVTPATVPDPPLDVQGAAGDRHVAVSWTVPAFDGGSPITGYAVTAIDSTTAGRGGETCATTGSTACTVTGLTDGDQYTFSVTATNIEGTSVASTPSPSLTPATVPTAPTGVSASAGNADAVVSWSSPGTDGGSAVTSYAVATFDVSTSTSVSNGCTWSSGPLHCTVPGLTNGDTYDFTVIASNVMGPGASSSASNHVVPSTVPGAPRFVAATPGNQSAQVTWSAPSSNGGAPISGYQVTATDHTTAGNGGETCGWASGPLGCTVSGLTNGDRYTFSVTAANGDGTGTVSSPSGVVTPATTPDAPQGANVTGGDASAVVTWSPPDTDGGSSITGYTVTATDTTTPASGGQTCAWTSGPLTCTVPGLTNGDDYTFSVTATNSVGTGPASSASNDVVPATTPDAPQSVAATPGTASAILTWSPPDTDGGSPITGYTVTATDSTTPGNGGETCTWTSGPLTCTVLGLTTGDSYTFTATAANSVGTGPASAPSNVITAL